MASLSRHRIHNTVIQKVCTITLCWVIIQSVLYVQEYYSTMDLIYQEKLSGTFEFWPDFMGSLILSVFGGVIGGIILVSRRPTLDFQNCYTYDVIGSSLLFIIYYILIVTLGLFIKGYIYFMLQYNIDAAFDNSVRNLKNYVSTPSFLITMSVWGLMVTATRFILQISDRFGQGVFWKFIMGKYHRPHEEERIFMFLDLKGATSIAEKMESSTFFEMLKEVYKDITVPIVESLGEIYQYVGDEVVITWPVDKGIMDNNALQCFFRIESELAKQKAKYIERYGIIPAFKAGLHVGKATTGEIGVIKKEIVYSGDVLNTTSRIQALCNFFDVKILISSTLLQLMKLGEKYLSIPIGDIELRGKKHKIALNTIQAV